MTKKIKILYIHHGTGIGGAPISLINLITYLDKELFEFKVALIKKSDVIGLFNSKNVAVEILDGSTNYFIHHEKGKINPLNIFRYFRIISSWLKTYFIVAPDYLIKNRDFDIVHLNSDVLSSWAMAAKKLNFKVVCHNRDPIAKGFFGMRRSILRFILKSSVDKIINISFDNNKRLGLTEISDVIYNSIPIPKDIKSTKKISQDKFVCIYVGGDVFFKGFGVIIDSIKFLNNRVKINFLGAYGSISKTNKLKNLIKLVIYHAKYSKLHYLNTWKNKEIIGMVKNPLPFIQESDVLITPFTIEHFSRPAIEAFAYGKPVIASNVEGMNEIVDNGINGILVEKNNPKALAEAINYLSENPEIVTKMGVNGRKKAEELFDPLKNSKKVEKIYLDLIKNRD